MEDKVICFSCGLSPADIDKGRDSFARLHPEVPRPEVIALTGAMLELPVGEVLGEALFGGPPKAVQDTKETREELFPGIHTYRTVIVYAAEREQVFQVMRSFKAVLPEPQDIVFAVITETAIGWLFRDYIVHLAQEHEQMQKHGRESSPDRHKT